MHDVQSGHFSQGGCTAPSGPHGEGLWGQVRVCSRGDAEDGGVGF